MPLIIYNGKLLLRSDGSLATDLNCCCEVDPPPPCDDCCVRITSGALIDGVIKIFAFDGDNTLEISITTPDGTRVICEDDTIEIKLEYFVNDAFPVDLIDGSILFDPAWELMSHSPAADAGDDVQSGPGGYVYWRDEELSVSQDSLNASLKFNSCYFNFYSDLGAIVINVEGIEEVIAIERCNPLVECCTMPARCKPCCLVLDKFGDIVNPSNWVWNAEQLRFESLQIVEFNELKYYVLLWIQPPGPEEDEEADDYAIWCLDETWNFGLEISPGNEESELTVSGTNLEVTVDACEFALSGTPSPEPNDVTYDPLVIQWPFPTEGTSPLEYEWNLLRDCEYPGCSPISVGVEFSHPTYTIPGITFLIEFFECEKETVGGCECGCPCCGFALPETLTIEWTYEGVDYSVDIVARIYICGSPVRWSYSDEEVLTDIIGITAVEYRPPSGLVCLFDENVFNLIVEHSCVSGWNILIAATTGSNAHIIGNNCELPASVTNACGVTYTIRDGT